MEKISERVYGFDADIRQNSKVLILGTLPSPKSLSHQKYFDNPTNKFWSILFLACGKTNEDSTSDDARARLLDEYSIAIWDVLESAIRETARDADLYDELPNNLPQLLANHSNLKLLLFHSNSAYKYFHRFFKNTTIPYIRVSSPSGLNRMGIEEKVAEWRAALSSVIPQLQTEHKLSWKAKPIADIIESKEENLQMANKQKSLVDRWAEDTSKPFNIVKPAPKKKPKLDKPSKKGYK